MNKVNLCWVFSDGRKGHEIQSMTLARALAEQVEFFPFTLKQPWLTFAPRRLPRFDLAINGSIEPQITTPPDLIITTGRIAAAVGKHYKSKLIAQSISCKHIHILNPKDNLNKYDWVLIPEHDDVKGENVINFVGSIHPYNQQWFEQDKDESFNQYLAIFIGNPKKEYFKNDFAAEIAAIQEHFKESPLYFCGSPRLNPNSKEVIKSLVRAQDKIWLDELDGPNPYESLLKNAKKIFVTSDSINMVNEACASSVPVSILAEKHATSPKHRRFLNSLSNITCAISKEKRTIKTNFPDNLIYALVNRIKQT